MKKLEFTSRGGAISTAQRQRGLPIYEVGQRVKLLRDVGKTRKPYGTVKDIQRRRDRVVLVVERDNLPPPGLRGPFPKMSLVLPAACVAPLYWRGPAKTVRNHTYRRPGYTRTPVRSDEIESIQYIR